MRRLTLLGLLVLGCRSAGAAPIPRDTRAEAVSEAVTQLVDRITKETPPKPPGDGEFALYLADLTTGRVTPVPCAADDWEKTYCGSPGWSADGRRIFYDASPGHGQWGETRVHMIEAADRGLARTVLGPGNCPAPSPDGKAVAFLLNLGGTRGVHVMSAAGGDSRAVGLYGIPRWSPAGRDLLVAQFGSPTTVEIVDADEGTRRPVDLPGYAFRSPPNWAGDRTLVAAVKSDAGDAVALVDVTDPAKAVVKELLWKRGAGPPEAVTPGAVTYSAAAGRGVFIGRGPEGGRLYVVEAGKPPRPLEPKRPAGKVAAPALSPDGRYLLFCDGRRE